MARRSRRPLRLRRLGLARTGKVAVIGVGNLLLKDEGVGIHVVRELQKNGLPERVKIIDGGLGGMGLLDFFQEASKVLLVDAADMNLKIGAVVRFTPDEVRGRSISRPRFSAHDLDLLDVLELARELKRCPARKSASARKNSVESRWNLNDWPITPAISGPWPGT